MLITEIVKNLKEGAFDEQLQMLNCRQEIDDQKERYLALLDSALEKFGDRDAHLICAPGRTEVGGNHTDHQLGRVLAASVNMDIACVVCPSDDVCEYYSEGYEVKPVRIDELNPKEEERKMSDLTLTVAGTMDKITMIEAGANEVSNDVMLNAIKEAHVEIKKICEFILKIKNEIGKEKFEYK